MNNKATAKRLGDGVAFKKRLLNIAQMPNRNTDAEYITVSPTIAQPMVAVWRSVCLEC